MAGAQILGRGRSARAAQRRHHLRAALSGRGFRQLLAVRLAGQFADGVFQASLAGAVLFNPEKQASAADVAAGFAVLLLPYSLIGPFTGVLLDRWWRQRVMVVSGVLRAIAVCGIAAEIGTGVSGEGFYVSALVVLSISRFFLSALSAGLPHVVPRAELVTANAFSTTLGTIAATVGGAAAIGVRLVTDGGDAAYAGMAVASAVPYLVSAWAAGRFPRTELGPDDLERSHRETVAEIARGLVAGARHLRQRRPALLALTAIGVHRLCYGLWIVCGVLLYRNYYRPNGPLRTDLAGLGQFVTAVAVGGALAALVTPAASRRWSYPGWSAILLAASGVIEVACGLPYRLPLQLAGGLLLGFTAQGVKICTDTQLQRHVSDEFRGRVFALYDTLFNLALVVAAGFTALVLPEDGRAPVAVVVLGLLYLATAAWYAWVTAARPTTS